MAVEGKSDCLQIAIVEDVPNSRESLAFLINHADGMTCVAAVASAEEAITQFPALCLDLILLDIRLAGAITGTDCIRQLQDSMPSAKIVMLTASQDAPTVVQCLMRGATGYLHKSLPPEQIPKMLKEAAVGYLPMSPDVAHLISGIFRSLNKPTQEWSKLSAREQQVLDLLTHGYLKKEIADLLGISEGTVRTHCLRVYEKLQVQCREHAVAKGIPFEVLHLINGSENNVRYNKRDTGSKKELI